MLMIKVTDEGYTEIDGHGDLVEDLTEMIRATYSLLKDEFECADHKSLFLELCETITEFDDKQETVTMNPDFLDMLQAMKEDDDEEY